MSKDYNGLRIGDKVTLLERRRNEFISGTVTGFDEITCPARKGPYGIGYRVRYVYLEDDSGKTYSICLD